MEFVFNSHESDSYNLFLNAVFLLANGYDVRILHSVFLLADGYDVRILHFIWFSS